MKSLNLLPQKTRDLIRLRKIGDTLRFWVVWILLLTLFGIGLMVSVGFIVRFQEQSFSVQVESLFSQQLFREIAERESSINVANVQLLKGQAILEERFDVHALLIDLGELLPDEIYLEVIAYDGEKNELRLRGFAPFRDDVLSIERLLLSHPLIVDVESPVSNILESTNINFVFTAILVE